MNYSSGNLKRYQIIMDRVVRCLICSGITVSVMESCTGGLFASGITDTQGASEIFLGSFVTYSNEAKKRNGVFADIIERYGVYSSETAAAMAEACRDFYHADIGVGITGSTGNADPCNADSVPGEVFYAILWNEKKVIRHLKMETADLSRREMKERIVEHAAESLAGILGIEHGDN